MPITPPRTMSDAEQLAGVESRCIRGDDSSIIDVCTIDTSLWSKWKKDTLCQNCSTAIGSSTLLFDTAWGATMIGLSFTEAHLALNLIRYLQSRGLQPNYRPLLA
ncbi:hypothetical protein N7522_004001 [Penicillium canescens]|nr:hypothetical protein N7522_004001 [Penicillium canescens]